MQTLLKIDGGFMKASDFLEAGIKHLSDRAVSYDAPHGERSMAKTVAIFNELIGEKLIEPLSEEDGWNFMQILKLVRSKQGWFKADSYEDGAAYAALAGEAAAASRGDWRHMTVSLREKGSQLVYERISDFFSRGEIAGFIESHLAMGDADFILRIGGVLIYDHTTAKEGDLEKVVEQLKCQA